MKNGRREFDEAMMREALAEAVKGIGLTRPNPPVGAVVVKNGSVIGRGFHPAAGKPHAEIHALRRAGSAAKGATLFITLEPCSTQGRTPACTDAIIRSGVERVVYACVDPNPRHAGRADALLRKAGIQVSRGVLKEQAGEILRPFAMRISHGRPFLTLKIASTFDGRIADATGRSRWITGPESRAAVQALRRTADAIMVGAQTLRSDNPSLLPKPARGRNPFRVVVTSSGDLPVRSRLFSDAMAGMTIVACGKPMPAKSRQELEKLGVRIWVTGTRNGSVDLGKLLNQLAGVGIMHVLCEGGGVLAGHLLRKDLVDELWMFYGAKLLGSAGRSAVDGRWTLGSAPGFEIAKVLQSGRDALIISKPSGRKGN